MKKIIIVLASFFTLSVMANLEHKPGQNGQPSKERLSRARGCFTEIQEHGCAHPREGQEIFKTCLEDKIEILTPSCQAFFKKLYGTKN